MQILRCLILAHVASAAYIWPRQATTCTNQSHLIGDFSLAEPSLLKVPPIVDDSARLVTFPVFPGTDLSSLSPTFCTADKVSGSPASGSAVNLSRSTTYQLSSTTGVDTTWTFQAVEMGSPALPGLYADPNIAVFDNTFYIFPTTDGFPGWGGTVFYVWSSKDLVMWNRSENPILTLEGSNGNVPWANGNAWAPTITQKDGMFYLYFSGNNTELNTKTIGAAIASSPLGPWTAQASPMILNNERITVSQAIDPATFSDPVSGKHYLFWGNGDGPILAELNDDMVSINWDTAQTISGLVNFREASFVNYRQGVYHYTYSMGDTRAANYSVGYATSTNIYGPYTYHGILLQHRPESGILATGSNSIIQIPGRDAWYIAYHRFAIPDGNGTDRQVAIDRVNIGSDGLFQPVTPTLEGILEPPASIQNRSR